MSNFVLASNNGAPADRQLPGRLTRSRSGRRITQLGVVSVALALLSLASAVYMLRLLAPAYVNTGNAALNAGDYPAAIHAFDLALQYRPDYVEALNGRGAAYARQGQTRQAIADFTRAIEILPDNAQAYYSRGLAYTALGQTGFAIADFQQVLVLSDDPNLLKAAAHQLIALESA